MDSGSWRIHLSFDLPDRDRLATGRVSFATRCAGELAARAGIIRASDHCRFQRARALDFRAHTKPLGNDLPVRGHAS